MIPRSKRFSIINQVIGLMLLIAILGIIGMTISNRMIISVQGNAHAINKSGSLRMQSYRLLSLLPLNKTSEPYLEELEQTLTSDELLQAVQAEKLSAQLSDITHYWKDRLRPTLELAKNPNEAKNEVVEFVNKLDHLVYIIDETTENKFTYVAMTQIMFIALVFLLLICTICHLRRKFLYPWNRLLNIVSAIGHKDFSQRYPVTGKQDELDALGLTLNQMSDELAESYHQLEARVEEKTADLWHKNQQLSFLYQSNQTLHSREPICAKIQQVLIELQKITSVKNLRFRLYEDNNEKYYNEIFCYKNQPHLDCQHNNCQICQQNMDYKPLIEPAILSWELADNIHRYGVIIGETTPDNTLSQEQDNLVLMLVKQISGMLAMEYQIEQQQQLLLMDERSAIARELHDSIAQSLSCLKMQISYLQMQANTLPENCQVLLGEMRQEINSAYSQLRELLTTFRLKLAEPGLLPSLENTLNEFNQRLGFIIELDYNLPAKSVSSHQAIHIIQIIREALSNILKHAHANWAAISLSKQDNKIIVIISDNGEGIEPNPEKQNHYGLIIMKERAQSLNGTCVITPRKLGGTDVSVTFPFTPKTINTKSDGVN
ncbi:nitrate/nitrite two-component system sensor histidine kinase NarX [Moellerella wisconsensis]|uniref:nitrate/nitrite two-component system sensor histidine kinase NarX n=1 Tax=Moellerella wisconsensis TaxID=158849 RepID=UPI001F4DDE03|nr:nitrate/nitrite two-component system sensor histidine kinase NarX [Moellerella wisconsensis]UNH26887.1 nitrate/nitrite two-component system sensor histidine kinase NarX [Moellerella wisconsensis]